MSIGIRTSLNVIVMYFRLTLLTSRSSIIMIILFFLLKCTYIYEIGEKTWQCSDYFKIILRIVPCIIFITFLAMFGNLYLNVILFAGTEHSGVVT